MGASITLAGEDLIAQKQGAQEALNITRFIFANVPGLDPNAPLDRAAPKPPAGQIVHQHLIPADHRGYVNPSQVVYSAQIGSDVGDWDFNWIGLESAEGVLFAVATVALQQKRRNIPPIQVGNNLTRNFLVVFDGAQALTGITIDASTWQHDFTVRLSGIDERERQSNRDIFGRACFFGSALQLEKVGATYQLKPGTAYIEGIRLQLSQVQSVAPTAFPTTAWLDVALQRELSDVVAAWKMAWGAGKTDYVDSAGVQHYLVRIAELPSSNTITDVRPVEPINGPLVQAFAFRNGDYAGLRARATTKADVGLSELPNAKSDDPSTNSSEILATTAALQMAMAQVVTPLTGMVAAFSRATAPAGWLKANGAAVSRTTYAALFAVIGTTFGAGDGATTFNLPDVRGEFLRAWDDGRGVDPGRVLGSTQAWQNASHSHSATVANAGEHTHSLSGSAEEAGEHTHTVRKASAGNNTSGSYVSPANQGSSTTTSNPAGAHTHTITGTAESAGEHTHVVTVSPSGGSEARPRNLALLACIKF